MRLDDALRFCDHLYARLGLDLAAWTSLAGQSMAAALRPPDGTWSLSTLLLCETTVQDGPIWSTFPKDERLIARRTLQLTSNEAP